MAEYNQNIKIADTDIDTWLNDDEVSDAIIDENEDTALKYSKKIVAFLDLLGITYSVKNYTDGKESEIISTMSSIKNIVEYEVNRVRGDISMLYISDSFIFVADPDIVGYMLEMLSAIQTRILIEERILLRGAIEYGDVIVQDEGKQIIGPAYIDAYINQEHNAIYPRIILGQSVIHLIQDKYSENMLNSYDGQYSLDYLDIYMSIRGESKSKMTARLRREHIFDFLDENYDLYLKKENISVYTKYAWTINYLKEKRVWDK